jgi:hypothetical protein
MSATNLIRWSGLSLILAGVLLSLATIIHPSSETVSNILAQEGRLITGHWLYTFYSVFLLLGLSGFYATFAARLGRAGLTGFLLVFFGTLFYAVSSDYGFNAPVLARLAPATLNAINAYPPVMTMDVLMVICMLAGFILLGIAIQRTSVLPAWPGILMALGWPLYMIAGAISLELFQPLWFLVILAALIAGAGMVWLGSIMWMEKKLELLPVEEC